MAIEKIIHQVWIGSKKMPIEWMNTWKEKNPSFEYVLWDEEKINKLKLKNRDKYDYFVSKEIYHGAVDIVRIEILDKFGGIYIDADSICLESIENEFFIEKDFFAVKEYEGRIANGTIGAIKGHSILKEYIKRISEAKKIEPPCYTIGGTLFTDCIKNHGKDNRIIILPTYSFYPKDHCGHRAKIEGKSYAKQKWGTSNNLYEN